MAIEDEIKQRSFHSLQQKASINLLFTTKWLEGRLQAYLKPENLTPQQFNVLRILRGAQEPLSTSEIKSRMIDKNPDTSRLVERLKQKGVVAKCGSDKDKRLVSITITEEGLRVLERLDGIQYKIDHLMSGLSDAEAEQLSALLDKARAYKPEGE